MRKLFPLATLLVCAGAAQANPFELFGFTPRAMGLGGAMTPIADDVSSSFYNPAGLLGHSKTEFGIGFSDTFSSLYVNRSKAPVGCDAQGLNCLTNTADPQSSPRFELGLIFPLGGALLKDRVVIGIGGGHPVGSLIRVQTVDEAHPQFYMYQSKAQRFALNAAIGIRIVNGLSIGAGAEIIAQQIGKVNFQLDIASRKFVARNITVDLNTVPTPLVGILVEPNDSLKIGLSWRKESELFYTQPTGIDLGDLGALNLDVQGIAQYWPNVFSGGVSYRMKRLMFSAQVDYMMWSNAPNDQVQVSVKPTGAVFDALGLSAVLSVPSVDARMGFVDIFVGHLGVEYNASDSLALRAGISARPAVTPDQNGTTNYLDNKTETIGAGLSYKFIDPLKVFTDPVTFDIGASAIIANERTSKKQAADPTGNQTYGGALFSVSAMLRYLY